MEKTPLTIEIEVEDVLSNEKYDYIKQFIEHMEKEHSDRRALSVLLKVRF